MGDGRIITGNLALLGASSTLLLNALKALCGLPDELLLYLPEVIEPIQRLKTGALKPQSQAPYG